MEEQNFAPVGIIHSGVEDRNLSFVSIKKEDYKTGSLPSIDGWELFLWRRIV